MVEMDFHRCREDSIAVWRSVHSVIKQRSLKIVYQPIVDHVQHKVIGYEALSRPFMHGKLIRPDMWFRAAYDCHCSGVADLLALECIFENATSVSGEVVLKSMFVNVMPSSLQEPVFLEGLELLIRKGVCQPDQLVMEIIEYIDYDPRSLAEAVHTLRSFGIRIALDDFGVHGVGLDAVSQLCPNFVKVDQSLILGIAESASKRMWLSDLVRHMECDKYTVIAEGIENIEDLFAVQDAGVSLSQGYYWGRPAPSAALPDLTLQIELEKRALADIVRQRNGVLTDPAVIRKSNELDLLIVQYHRLNKK